MGWFDQRYEDAESIVIDSVGSNTFRAFRHMPERPSIVFRAWARGCLLGDGFLRKISELKTREEYDLWIRNLSNSLGDYWEQRMGSEKKISYGPERKLPNLLMKHVVLWDRLHVSQRSRLIGFLHVPLDSYSLLMVKDCVLDSEHYTSIGRIRSNATMGSVVNETMYDALQALFREVAEEAGVPAICLDVLAWNKGHE